ncbi:MAG: asparagine synthase C-terminal domain-containing protein, partial [bacterium]|nr:asparagine synthase C-terminal domain-containing protein [bacterium]
MNDFISKLDSTLNILFQQYKLDLKNQPVGVLLSGGIDSSTISYYCQKYFQNVTFYSFGVKDNFDKPFAELIKLQFNIQLEYLEIDENMIVNHISKVKELLQQVNIETNLMQVSLAMGYFLIFQKIREMNINHIFTGQGPDILLAGYHKYKSLMTSEINATIEQDMPLL